MNSIYLIFLVPLQFKFVIFYEWDVYFGTLNRCWKFLKQSAKTRVISLSKTVLCIYLMAIFKDSSSFKVLCNIEAFCVWRRAYWWVINKAGSLFSLYILQWSEGLSCRNIYGNFFYNTFLYRICNKVILRRKYWCLHRILLKKKAGT